MVAKLTGQRFGRLVAVAPAGRTPAGRVLWHVQCDCGNTAQKPSTSLIRGQVQSCGCLGPEVTVKRCTTHGKSRNGDSTYNVWIQMRRRCRERKGYVDRGITVCDRWEESFENFLADMGAKPDDHQIDRIDNDRGYEPSNCRWATPKENSNNRRNTWRIEFDGRTQTAAQWADELGVNRQTIIHRHQNGRPLVR